MRVLAGNPYPQGATYDGKGVNFALFSAHATAVELCLFDSSGKEEIQRLILPCNTDDIWHGYIAGAGADLLYGYRVHGPYDPQSGHRFNPHKLLIDPYARAFYGFLRHAPENYGYIVGSPEQDLSYDTRDNAHNIPRCRVTDARQATDIDERVQKSMLDSVIYEVHVKGATRQLPMPDSNLRGTYEGLASDTFITHLTELGVTAIELLPIHAFCDEAHLVDKKLTNYWGYNSLSFFVPESRYARENAVSEFRQMVKKFHAHGIEVILDVVYNHTAESNELGPTYCYRGIDNLSYYRLAEDRRYYLDYSGCGNTLDCAHPRVNKLILDSLRYWVTEMQVDGFRFDLASILGREFYGFDRGSGFFDSVLQDPVLASTKLIAEPWDLGPDGYQLGQFPLGWTEWNDRSRDVIRGFWNRSATLQSMSKVMHGSSELFEWQRRGPAASLNFITSHDGFTLTDVVSYNERHNEKNGEENRDGHDHNLSFNHGVEGPSQEPEVKQHRDLRRRNLMASLLLAQGVPMLTAGDEFGRTQGGNNNAYCQDNETTWLDWSLTEDERPFLAYVKKLLLLRKQCPVLRRPHYLHGFAQSEAWNIPDIQWFNSGGSLMEEGNWQNESCQFMGMLLPGDARALQTMPANEDDGPSVLILINNSESDIDFPLPGFAKNWISRINTADPDKADHELHHRCRCSLNSVRVCTSVLSRVE